MPAPEILVQCGMREGILIMFHGRIERWDAKATCRFVCDWLCWPSMAKDVTSFLKICIVCQKCRMIPRYLTTHRILLTALIETFSIHIVGSWPTGVSGEINLVIDEAKLTDWPVLRYTKNDTSDVIGDFVEEKIKFTFGPPKKYFPTTQDVLRLRHYNL